MGIKKHLKYTYEHIHEKEKKEKYIEKCWNDKTWFAVRLRVVLVANYVNNPHEWTCIVPTSLPLSRALCIYMICFHCCCFWRSTVAVLWSQLMWIRIWHINFNLHICWQFGNYVNKFFRYLHIVCLESTFSKRTKKKKNKTNLSTFLLSSNFHFEITHAEEGREWERERQERKKIDD